MRSLAVMGNEKAALKLIYRIVLTQIGRHPPLKTDIRAKADMPDLYSSPSLAVISMPKPERPT